VSQPSGLVDTSLRVGTVVVLAADSVVLT